MSENSSKKQPLRSIKIATIGLFLLSALLPLFTVRAQNSIQVLLSELNTDEFPNNSAFLNVRDAEGHFIHNLRAKDVRIYEDNNMVSINAIEEMRPGAQIVVAINPGPTFAIRNSQALSRYDLLIAALNEWGKSRIGSNTDDLSLLTTGGESLSHTSQIDHWLDTLNKPQIDARTAEPSIDTLNRAVALAADKTPRPGMGRTVLFVTAPMEKLQSDALETTVTQAREAGVAINIWLVASPGTASTQFAQQLQAVSESTGGSFYIFAGDEIPPSPETYFEHYRDIYTITYESQVRSSGKHQVLAEVTVNTQAVKSPVQSFEIEILPPSPVFVSPPLEIVRKPPIEEQKTANKDGENSYKNFIPETQLLEVVIDFPDGRLRPIVKSSLYVDDELAVEIKQPPFDQFVWDLSTYSTNETHQLQVKVEDEFGLSGESSAIPINVLIQIPQQKPLETLKKNTPLLTGLVALLAGIILFLVLVLGGRLTPRIPAMIQRRRLNTDPVTQPVPVREEPTQPVRKGLAERLKLRKKVFPPSAIALLSRLSEDDTTIDATPIPITTDKTTFGTDPKQATIILDDPSVDPLHASLTREADDSFRLADMNTIAGTWINYTPVSTGGAHLEHGDLVHIGRVGFRFLLRKPPSVHISVEPLTSESESDIKNPNNKKN